MKFLLSFFIISSTYIFPMKVYANDRVVVWEIVPTVLSHITTNTPYKLFCETNRSYLDYYSRDRGINLAFNYRLSYSNMKFVRADNSTGPVKYGDKIAIYIEHGGYLYYTRRLYGINLSYSSTPVYQWEIRDNSYLNPATPPNHNLVPGSATIALFNTYNSGYLIYGERTWGPNLKWADVTTSSTSATVAQINGFVRTGPFPFRSTSGKCTSPITWTFTPIRLLGSSGLDHQFVISKNYEAAETNTGPSEWWCVFTDLFPGIKTGVWKIKVQTPLWFTECQVTLNNGVNNMNFTVNKAGCGTGLQFPN